MTRHMDTEGKVETGKSVFPALAVFLLFVLVVGAGGRLLCDRYEQQAKAEATSSLAGTGKLRVAQLSAFLKERRGGARVAADLLGAGVTHAWWQGRDRDLPAMARRTLDSIVAEYGYTGAMILDARGDVRFSAGRSAGLSATGKSIALRALGKASPVFSDLYFADPAAPQKLMLDTFAPVMSTDGTKAVGVLVVRGDWDYLFSAFQPWPEDSRSAEFLLVRKDDANVLFLNQLRHREQAMDILRTPLSGDADSPAWPAIRAVQGQYGTLESIDYRGKPVLSYSLSVPDTDWSMVVKEDVVDALKGFRRIETVATFSFLVVAALAFALWWWWWFARGRAEQALQRERDFAAGLIKAAPAIMVMLDLEGRIRHINPYSEKLTGWRLDEVRDKDWFATFLPERDRERIRALFRTVARDVPVHGFVNPIVTRSGEEREIEWHNQVVRDEQGNIAAVLAIGQDVTERRYAEVALRASEERLKEAQRIAKMGNWELDLVGGKLIWSDEIFRIFEIDQTKFGATYEAFLDAIHPQDREAVNAAYTGSLNTREPYDITHRLLMADGRIKYVQERCESDFDAAGKPIRSLGTVQDVTDLKRADEALRQLNAELEQRIRERTAKLEVANTELETFTYSVAHDLKAPLRGIDGYSQLLLAGYSDKLDDEGRQFLGNVRQAAQQMGELINDLLAYSRLERRDMRTDKVNPQELIEALIAERADEIEARGVAVTMAVSCTSATADLDGLALALRNLLENALKFTANVPQPMIEIGGRDTGTTCIFSVRDNGIGFDMKFHDRIFDIFQRLHRSEDYPGTGVGLAIVKKVMERMGGRVWAESEPGKGATFYLEIPE